METQDLVTYILSAYSVLATLVALTPTEKDNDMLARVVNIVKKLASVLGGLVKGK